MKHKDMGFFIFRMGTYVTLLLTLGFGLMGWAYSISTYIQNWVDPLHPTIIFAGHVPFLDTWELIPNYVKWIYTIIMVLSFGIIWFGGELMLEETKDACRIDSGENSTEKPG